MGTSFAWVSLATYLAGFASAVFAEPVRRWLFRPELELDLDASAGQYVTRTVESGSQGRFGSEAYYIRFRVHNKKKIVATKCRAYLVNVEREDGDVFKPTVYCDSIQLAWSARGEGTYDSIDLHNGVFQFVDVVSTRPTLPNFSLSLFVIPNIYALTILHRTGRYRLTAVVSGENVKPKRIQIVFNWTGQWDGFEVNGCRPPHNNL